MNLSVSYEVREGADALRSGCEKQGSRGEREQGRKVGTQKSFQHHSLVFFSAIFLSTFTFCLYAQDTLLTKAFSIKFKKVDEVASVINGLLSEKGALTLQPRLQTIVVQDYEKNLRQVEMAIAAFDVPPPAAEVSVKLVRASKNAEPSPISDEIKNMARVGDVLKFNQYSLLDSGIVECEEGQNSVLSLAQEYQISFVPDIIQEGNNIIRLKNFQLKKKKKDGNGKDSFLPLLTVTVNLKNAETLVLGASRFEESDQALLIMLLGKVKK